ncbi:MAG TPA: hypothetical protein VFM41_12320 [Gaiella sp.]|jgi:hypothetical protein|nr:hypothetical protein [Gaiella sp.]
MTEVVSLTVPSGATWAGVVELVLAGLGARLDLPYDRIDELQLATRAALSDATGPDVHVDATANDDRLDVRIGPLEAAAAADPGRKRVLDALADGIELGPAEDGVTWAVLTFSRGGAR